MTNAESSQANSHTVVTVYDDQQQLFLSPKWKKTCLKQQLENFIQQRNGKQT